MRLGCSWCTRSNQKYLRLCNMSPRGAVTFLCVAVNSHVVILRKMPYPHKKAHEVDTPTKNCIIGFYLATGNATAAASQENIPPHTAQYIIQRYKQTGSASNRHRSGRPSTLTDYDKCEIVRTARKNWRMPLGQIANQVSAHVSISTV